MMIRYSAIFGAALAASLLVAANGEGVSMWCAYAVAAAVITIVVWAHWPSRHNGPGQGRYLATVCVRRDDYSKLLWSRQYRTYLGALLGARRVALRSDFLGDQYSDFEIKGSVTNLARDPVVAAAMGRR